MMKVSSILSAVTTATSLLLTAPFVWCSPTPKSAFGSADYNTYAYNGGVTGTPGWIVWQQSFSTQGVNTVNSNSDYSARLQYDYNCRVAVNPSVALITSQAANMYSTDAQPTQYLNMSYVFTNGIYYTITSSEYPSISPSQPVYAVNSYKSNLATGKLYLSLFAPNLTSLINNGPSNLLQQYPFASNPNFRMGDSTFNYSFTGNSPAYWTGSNTYGIDLPSQDCLGWQIGNTSYSGAYSYLNLTTHAQSSQWLNRGLNTTCDNPGFTVSTVLCVAPWVQGSYTGASGDPQLTGFFGQSFQVHGTPDEVFNLFTSPSSNVNARFVYLAKGKNTGKTGDWTHPGTYLGAIGIRTGDATILVQTYHADGVWTVNDKVQPAKRMVVMINGLPIPFNATQQLSADVSVTQVSTTSVHVDLPMLSLDITQAGVHMNVEAALTVDPVKLSLHGLIGNTWSQKTFKGTFNKYVEGKIEDYQIEDSELFGSDFRFNLFPSSA